MSSRSASPRPPHAGLRPWLYPFYYHATAANHFLRRRIRPAGMGLLILGVVLACLAGGQASDPIFQLLSFAFCLGLLGLAALPFRRARLEIEREVPPHATAGLPVPIGYRLKNRGRFTLGNASLAESPADPRPARARFLTAREPGEEQRNLFDRLLAYYCWSWLCERRVEFTSAPPPLDPLRIAPGASARFGTTITPARRGMLQLDDLRVLLPDPLGFYQRCVRVRTAPAMLAVLPRRYRLPPIELPGSARLHPGGEASSRNHGTSGEFAGLRDYRAGDPLRLIHWKSWARTGRPIVKELEDNFYPRHGLLLDTFPENLDDELFEHAVSVAASFASSVDRRECLIDLMFVSGMERVVTAGRDSGRAEGLLRVLAGVEAVAKPDYDSLHRLVLRHADDLGGCLAVFAGWSDARAGLLRKLAAAGLETAAIVICHEPPETRPARVHFVRAGAIVEDLARLPHRL